jgi:aryl-alcohol dehydrogenase-like predicted oxidoreductase
LSGQYNQNSTFNDIRKRWSKEDIKNRAELVNQIQEIIPKNINIAQIAISYCLAYDAVSTVIPGNKSIEQLRQNVESIKNPIANELVLKFEDFYKKKVENLNLPW